MILDRVAFNRVRDITGYEHVEYQAEQNGLVKFKVWTGPDNDPRQAAYVWMREDFSIAKYEDVKVLCSERGWITYPQKYAEG